MPRPSRSSFWVSVTVRSNGMTVFSQFTKITSPVKYISKKMHRSRGAERKTRRGKKDVTCRLRASDDLAGLAENVCGRNFQSTLDLGDNGRADHAAWWPHLRTSRSRVSCTCFCNSRRCLRPGWMRRGYRRTQAGLYHPSSAD